MDELAYNHIAYIEDHIRRMNGLPRDERGKRFHYLMGYLDAAFDAGIITYRQLHGYTDKAWETMKQQGNNG